MRIFNKLQHFAAANPRCCCAIDVKHVKTDPCTYTDRLEKVIKTPGRQY